MSNLVLATSFFLGTCRPISELCQKDMATEEIALIYTYTESISFTLRGSHTSRYRNNMWVVDDNSDGSRDRDRGSEAVEFGITYSWRLGL